MSSPAARSRFCLVTSAHVSNNPRLVKEADALTERGHAVRVVAVNVDAAAASRDATVLRDRTWTATLVGAQRWSAGVGAARWLTAALRQRAASAAWRAGVRGDAVRDRALSRHVAALARVAAAHPADVVVAHNLQALPAAARAARTLGARLAFDIEDLHTGEFADPVRSAPAVALVRDVERRYLPGCDLLTASAPGIADAVSAAYGVPRPVVVLNSFALSGRDFPVTTPPSRRGAWPSLYWFSQTIGGDRGLEDVVSALGVLRRDGLRAQLHVRGSAIPEDRERLEMVAAAHGVSDSLHFWPPAPPDEMVALAAEHDIGLALEMPVSLNRRLCVTNKLLTYLAAGIAVAATATPGQRAVLADAEGAGFLYDPGDVASLAASLRALLAQPETLARAKAAADLAARRRFCWEIEQRALVDAYEALLPRRASDAARSGAAAATGLVTA